MDKTKFETVKSSALIEIKCILPDKIIEGKLSKDIVEYNIDDPFSVSQALVNQPMLYANFALMLHIASSMKKDIEKEKDIWYKGVREKVTKKLLLQRKADKLKQPTKDDIDAYIITHYPNTYKEFEDKLGDIENKIGLLDVATKTFIQRKEMLSKASSLVETMIHSDLLIVKNKLGRNK